MTQYNGRLIKLFLVNGSPNGLMIAEITDWTGIAFVIPRLALKNFLDRKESEETGVYILTCSDLKGVYDQIVYVGQSDSVGSRLKQHDKNVEKDFERAIVFISKDKNLTSAHARHLESELVKKIKLAGRAGTSNGNDPGGSSLPESDISDMNRFMQKIELVLPVLGLDILRPIPSRPKLSEKSIGLPENLQSLDTFDAIFIFEKDGTCAEAIESKGEFVVLTGSLVRVKENPTIPTPHQTLRKSLIQDGGLVETNDPKLYKLTKDVPFKSPSAAAGMVYGGTANGQWEWKVKETGESYADWRETTLMRSS